MKIKFPLQLAIVAGNLLLLTGLLAIWTDELETTFDGWARPMGFALILIASLLSLIGIRIFLRIRRKWPIGSTRKNLAVLTAIPLLISSWLYLPYIRRTVVNGILDRQVRGEIIAKSNSSDRMRLAEGYGFKDLDPNQYHYLSRLDSLPAIPADATHIDYLYSYDGFLPDYYLKVAYDMPANAHIESYSREDERHFSFQTIQQMGEHLRVSFEQGIH